jgi:hypothetical protein
MGFAKFEGDRASDERPNKALSNRRSCFGFAFILERDAGVIAPVAELLSLGGMSPRSRKITIGVVCGLCLYLATWIATIAFSRIDYARILLGKDPIFARRKWILTDGGSVGYQGIGYFLIRVNTMRERPNLSDPRAYDTGAKLHYQLRWLFPSFDQRLDREHVEVSQ